MSKSNAWDELLDNEISIPRLCSRGGDPVAGMSAESPSWAHNKTPLGQPSLSSRTLSELNNTAACVSCSLGCAMKQTKMTNGNRSRKVHKSNPCPEYFQLEKILFRDQAWPLQAKHTDCGDSRLLYQIVAKIATLCSPSFAVVPKRPKSRYLYTGNLAFSSVRWTKHVRDKK